MTKNNEAPTLDGLLTATYVILDDAHLKTTRRGPRGKCTDVELICIAVAQVLLDCPNERRWQRLCRSRLSYLFPNIPDQSNYNRRLRRLAPQLIDALGLIAFLGGRETGRLRLMDSTPVPCGQSRETARRSDLAGLASYGYCASHSRYFWGFRLHLLCDEQGFPVGFELAAANIGDRRVANELLTEHAKPGDLVLADKNYSGRELEELSAALSALLLRPDRRNEPHKNGSLGGCRQWIESVFWTLKNQLSLERHGARTLSGLIARVVQRLLALGAAIHHNTLLGCAARSLVAYDH